MSAENTTGLMLTQKYRSCPTKEQQTEQRSSTRTPA